jgi:membrane fusion protein, multidrug efflux system
VRVGVAITRTSVLSEAVPMNDTTLIERSSNAIEGKTRPKVSPWRLAIIAAAATGVVGVLAFASYWWTTGRFIESTDDAYVGGDITVIAPKVAGFISEVAVKDNQPVRAGDIRQVATLFRRLSAAYTRHASP